MRKIIFVLLLFFLFSLNSNAAGIPRLSVYGNIDNMNEKSDEREVYVKYSDNVLVFESDAMLKLQGASTLKYDKKNFNITFYEDDSFKIKQGFDVKWGEMSKYTLKANWMDKTHTRNIVSANIYADIQKKYDLFNDCVNNGVVDGFPIEIYVNDKFYGLYTMNLHKDYFFDLDENNSNNILFAGKASTLITNFKMEADTSWYSFEVEVGDESQESVDKLNRMIRFVKDSSDEEFIEHFNEYFNFDAMLNYYCYLMFAGLVDNADNNLFLVTYDGLVWFPSMYDLDLSYGVSRTGDLIPYDLDMSFARNGNLLWQKFEKNFADYIVVRYYELREDILTKEYIMNEFNTFYNLIPKETLLKEQNKWGEIPGNDISQIEEFLDVRIPFIDQMMNDLKTDNYENIYNSFGINKIDNKKNNDYKLLIIGSLILIILLIFIFELRKKRIKK